MCLALAEGSQALLKGLLSNQVSLHMDMRLVIRHSGTSHVSLKNVLARRLAPYSMQ